MTSITEQTQVHRSTCPRDCYDACGLTVKTRNDIVIHVSGDPEHLRSKGRLCQKCSVGYNTVWIDPKERITQPLRRIGKKGEGKFEPISWHDAMTEISSRLKHIINNNGAEKILTTHYTGTFTAIGYHFPMRFFNRMGATEVNPDSVCNLAGHIALEYVYGSSLTGFDPRTAKDSSCIMVWGGNPSTAGSHVDQHWLNPLSDKLIVIDPIKTATAAKAALHLQPFPGSDAALAFSIMHSIKAIGNIDQRFIDDNTTGWQHLDKIIEQCPAEWGERQTGVPAADILKAAKMYSEGPSLLWLGQGFQRQPRGGNAMRACAMLPPITGNLGKPGAGFLYLNGLDSRGINDDYLLGSELQKGEPSSISHMDLAETLENSDESKALFCWNVNNVSSNPEQSRLKNAMLREDLLTIVADLFPTDTTDYADYVLPAASFLESDDLFASYFDLTLSAQTKVTEPMGESRSNSDIFRMLSRYMEYENTELYESDQQIIDNLLKQSQLEETFDSLKEKGTVQVSKDPVIQFESLEFSTASGKIELVSDQARQDGLPYLPQPHADERPTEGKLRLLTPGSAWELNSIYGNASRKNGTQGEPSVLMNPLDAKVRKLVDGDLVILFNDTGKINLLLSISTDVPQGVVVSYKGRWPKRSPTNSNINILNPGQKADMGASSAVHGIEVSLRRFTP